MSSRARDWFAQAVRDLEHAVHAGRLGRHEWACFAAQQSAEKAVMGLHLSRGQEAWGHVIATLLRELPDAPPEDLVERAHVLDGYYISTRYANGHPAGAPFEHFGRLQSEQAIAYAGEIVEFVRAQMAAPG